MSVSIKPLEDRIVIKQVEAEQTTASGLVIPDTAKEKPQEGEVVAVGPGRIDDNGNRVPLDVAVGDKVIYSKYGGTEVKYGGRGPPRPLGSRRARGRRPLVDPLTTGARMLTASGPFVVPGAVAGDCCPRQDVASVAVAPVARPRAA